MANNVFVGIIMGSDSDLETMRESVKTLEEFGIGCEVNIISAHRTPQQAHEYASSAEKEALRLLSPPRGEPRI